MFESGLHIPLMVYFPPKYAYLKPNGKRIDRPVSFIDFAPTVLSLAGIKPPDYMQGEAFLGKYTQPPHKRVHMYRARMDERYDLIRTLRNKHFLYIHNYMPQRIYGQHLVYLWKASSMQSWQKQYREGNLNATQKKFFQPKPAEELYNVAKDPHNIHNLAKDAAYKNILQKMRQENVSWMKKLPDLGFIPESMIDDISKDKSLYEAVRDKHIPMDKVIETAEKASMARKGTLDILVKRLNDTNAIVRYWAAMGMAIAGERAKPFEDVLLKKAKDPSPEVQLEVAEALYNMGYEDKAMHLIQSILGRPGLFLNLEALNVLESLNPDRLSPQLLEKVQKLNKKYDVDSEPKKYIHRAAESLLHKVREDENE